MPRDGRFWRNVAIVAVAHIAIAVTFIAWNRGDRTTDRPSILWMTEGLTEVASKSSPARTESPPEAVTPAQIHPSPSMQQEDQTPDSTPAKSDIQLPVPTPSPTPVKTPAPKLDATPVPKASPKKVATPTPKSTPKKTAVAKATPTPSPKGRVKASDQPKKDAESGKSKEAAKATPGPGVGSGEGKSAATGSDGGVRASEFSRYGKMLYERFYNDWIQPTTSVPAGAKMSALVKIRIEKDGRISKFTIVRPSGNVAVDESVAAVAKRITQVDPLPNGLGGRGFYEVNINFELNPTE